MTTSTAQTLTFDCPDIMNIADVTEMQGELLAMLDKGGEVIIDASRIERIDTAMLQVLCAFGEDARGRGIKLEWREPSEYFIESARQLDLAACLGLEQA